MPAGRASPPARAASARPRTDRRRTSNGTADGSSPSAYTSCPAGRYRASLPPSTSTVRRPRRQRLRDDLRGVPGRRRAALEHPIAVRRRLRTDTACAPSRPGSRDGALPLLAATRKMPSRLTEQYRAILSPARAERIRNAVRDDDGRAAEALRCASTLRPRSTRRSGCRARRSGSLSLLPCRGSAAARAYPSNADTNLRSCCRRMSGRWGERDDRPAGVTQRLSLRQHEIETVDGGRLRCRPAVHTATPATPAPSTNTPAANRTRLQSCGASPCAAGCASAANAPSSARRASPISRNRLSRSFCRHSSSVRRTAAGTVRGSACRSGSRSSTRASVLVASSAPKAGRPVSISYTHAAERPDVRPLVDGAGRAPARGSCRRPCRERRLLRHRGRDGRRVRCWAGSGRSTEAPWRDRNRAPSRGRRPSP